MVQLSCMADAGFYIQRPKAACHVQFKGVNSREGIEFYKVSKRSATLTREEMNDTAKYHLHNNETLPLYYPDARWHAPLKIFAVNKLTNKIIDSIMLVAEGNNLVINFTGLENNKLGLSIEKTKALYPYRLFSDSENPDDKTSARNKYILLLLSLMGFLSLGFILYKSRQNPGKFSKSKL